MTHRKAIFTVGIVLILLIMALSACVVNNPGTPESEPVGESTPAGNATTEAPAATVETTAPATTTVGATPEQTGNEFPEILVLHPDATDLEISAATNTYVYVVPLMVADTLAYLEPALKDKGWTELGKPLVMGHLATINLQREGYQLNVSMQDNERSKTTRVQMRLQE